ncbi:MAG: hypothetical protein SV775_03030 [Thermodesulfobacteriota bacterium]|nr:hypothetical protein [Thermodesulfobacteriota bacterium]
MSKVLNITERLESKKRKHQADVHHHKVETIQRIVQCSLCQNRCAMCGYHLNVTDSSCPTVPPSSDFNLCDSCRAEFEDFLEMSREKKGSSVSWHNKEWLRLWSAWLEYYQAIAEFSNSTQFRQLAEELDD